MISIKVRTPPAIRLITGTAKIRWVFGKCAITTQQTGIEIAPAMKAHDATATNGPAREKVCTVRQNSRLTTPNPKKEMWLEPVHPAFEAAVTAEPVFAVKEHSEHHAGDEAE